MPLHVSSTCAYHQEVKIALHSLWYHHTYRWPSSARDGHLRCTVSKTSKFIHLPMKMEPIASSETSAIRTQTPGNYPKRNKLHSEHGESLKTRLKRRSKFKLIFNRNKFSSPNVLLIFPHFLLRYFLSNS